MKNWWIYTTLLVAAIFAPLIGLAGIYPCREPISYSPPPLWSPGEMEIQEAILAVYRQMGFRGLAFDTSRLNEFFIDDPRFPLRQELREEVRVAFGQAPQGAGYLTYMRAWYKNWEARSPATMEEVWLKAIGARHRLNHSAGIICHWLELAREHLERRPGVKSLEAQLGYFPVFRDPKENESIPEDWIERFHFFVIEIEGDKATCLYEDWGTLRKAYLVNRDGRWYIADSILLAVYP